MTKETAIQDELNPKTTQIPKNEEKSFANKEVLPKMKKIEGDEPSHLQLSEKFLKRWSIEGLIGKGGYGEIYLAVDIVKGEEVAIKVEPKKRRGKLAKRMILEQHVMFKMQGKPHVPLMYGSGYTDKINFMIMQILSINVGDMKKNNPNKRLSQCSVGRIIHQSITALRDLHDVGYVHRDVKPANMCFGIYPSSRHTLILLDFGLVRRYKMENGEWREQRARAGFRGTTRYVSIRVHRRCEQAPYDDMVSVMYTAYELLSGELPWKYLEKSQEVLQLKEAMTENGVNAEFFKGEKSVLIDFFKVVSEMDSSKAPYYDQMIECIKVLYAPKTLTDPYEWEENQKNGEDASQEENSK
ncbi:hypothetical protein L5515_013710 [Caenorhabditis briggsae]|uniref:non-specific serine/threonine protein kinase n=1 Tax=Caenorhabditis briggsae TaxID=6238 RepID=A0AAE9EC95_CAEBR|nr:hypothetical protein L5515_013710 [Caenorhabditis briggsae]